MRTSTCGESLNGSALGDAPLPSTLVSSSKADSQTCVFYTATDLELAEMMKENEDDEKFELMHIQIVIYGISGIVCEKEEVKRKPPKRSGSGLTNIFFQSSNASNLPNVPGSDSLSLPTMIQTDSSVMTEEDDIVVSKNRTLMTAVISFNKYAISSDTSIETYLPSLPLCRPAKPDGVNARFNASWPAEKSILVQSADDIEQSSFNFTRCMRLQNYVPGIPTDVGAVSNYAHETVNLQLGLSKGTELIRLGTLSIAISGDEEGEFQMHLPIKPIERKKKRSMKCKTDTKWNKYGYFSDDVSKRFFLDENATARIGIKVIPHHTIKAAEEREQEELNAKFFGLAGSIEPIAPSQGTHRRVPKVKPVFNENPPTLNPAPAVSRANKPSGILNGFFCGALMCTDEELKPPEPPKDTIPESIDASTDIRRQFAAASLISSVSESSDDSSVTESVVPTRVPSQPGPPLPPSRLFTSGIRSG